MRSVLSAVALACLQGVALAAPAQEVRVFPSGDSVPENLLRIELRFAQPLRTPLDMSQVKLLDGQDREIPGAFLDLGLPSSDGKRVSLLLHPGRVKTGLGANERLGRALQAGTRVKLLIEHPELGHPAAKRWLVTEFDARPLQPLRWRIEAPRASSRDALVLHLDKPISSSAEALIAVRDPQGDRVPGSMRLAQGETVWRFMPARPWQAGSHAVVTHPELEDPAGNRPCAAFEGIGVSHARCDEGVVLPFEPRPAGSSR